MVQSLRAGCVKFPMREKGARSLIIRTILLTGAIAIV